MFLILTSHGSPAGPAVKAGRLTQMLTPSKAFLILDTNFHLGLARETSARFRPASIAVAAEKGGLRSYDFSTSRYLKRHPAGT
jgi:hypothetical protein